MKGKRGAIPWSPRREKSLNSLLSSGEVVEMLRDGHPPTASARPHHELARARLDPDESPVRAIHGLPIADDSDYNESGRGQ